MMALADMLSENRTLKELKLADQRATFSQLAEQRIADALESNHTIIRLTINMRSTRAKDALDKYLLRNQNELSASWRQRRAPFVCSC